MNKIKNILLIDDDDIVNLINTMVIKLNDQDIEVRSAINGSVALSMLKESIVNESDHFPDLIFLDINMPEMDGWEFLEELKDIPENILSKCKIIMLTSSIDSVDIKNAKNNPMLDDYVVKPLNIEIFKSLSSSDHVPFSVCESSNFKNYLK
ncbi:MAG: response regulator [Sphingobacteriia bacterium]|jgi:CheY-like chemotaxis protein